MSQLQAKIARVKLLPLYEELAAEQSRLINMLEANEEGASTGAKQALRDLDREQFASELRNLLHKAGVKDPDYVYNARGYRIFRPVDQRLRALGSASCEAHAVSWLLTYQQVRKYEGYVAAAREGRPVLLRYDSPEPYDEQTWIADRLRDLEQQVAEAKVERTRSSRTLPIGKGSKRISLEEHQVRRDEGRNRYNKAKSAEGAARDARAQGLADNQWRDNPRLSKSDVARRIAPTLIQEWVAENERRNQDGEGPSRLPSPNWRTIRRSIKKP